MFKINKKLRGNTTKLNIFAITLCFGLLLTPTFCFAHQGHSDKKTGELHGEANTVESDRTRAVLGKINQR